MASAPSSLARLFDARSVAVVGASASPEKPGYQMMRSLADFRGAVYPVNPRADEILGHRAYPDLASIGAPVDLVVLVVPSHASAQVLEEAAAIGAGSALMISGGFSETGDTGQAEQEKVLEICRCGGIRLIGPNTSGYLNPRLGLAATFLPPMRTIKPGPVAIVAQSGGINITLAYLAHMQGLGLRLAAGLGNAADIDVAEVVDYLADDADTGVIVVHLEGVPDGRRLFDAVRRATGKKPVVALPVGRADLGGFAESHTGNLMGRFELTRAALEQAGAVVVDGMADAIDAAQMFAKSRLAPDADPGIGILTGQAGPGLLMTDILRSAGVSVPEIAPRTVEKIAAMLPPLTFLRNPVDTGRPLGNFAEILSVMASDTAIDAIMIYALIEEGAIDMPAAIAAAVMDLTKPVLHGTCGVIGDIGPLMAAVEDAGASSYPAPDRMARAARALALDAKAAWRKAHDVPPATGRAIEGIAAGPLDEDRAKSIVEAAGIATPRRIVCDSHAAAEQALAALGGNVAVKILDASVTHKTEAGGVHIGIADRRSLLAALDRIDAIPTPGAKRYLVEEMASAGLELIIGGTNDPSWGPTVLLGLGGIMAEAYGDVALRIAPFGRTEALSMLDDLRGRAVFDGWRGMPPVDRGAVAAALVGIGALMAANPGICELDLNPVRATHAGLIALDALILLK